MHCSPSCVSVMHSPRLKPFCSSFNYIPVQALAPRSWLRDQALDPVHPSCTPGQQV